MPKQLLHFSYTLGEIDAVARQFWHALNGYRVFAFSGDLGAGKTTFIHRLCDYLQVEDTVSSPTFALINEYHFYRNGDSLIYHLDWYRLKDAAEAVNAGMEECLLQAQNGGAYCFIEWPERAPGLLQPPYVLVKIASADEHTRTMDVNLVEVTGS